MSYLLSSIEPAKRHSYLRPGVNVRDIVYPQFGIGHVIKSKKSGVDIKFPNGTARYNKADAQNFLEIII